MRMSGLDFGVFHVSQNWIGGIAAALATVSVVLLWFGIHFMIMGRLFRRLSALQSP